MNLGELKDRLSSLSGFDLSDSVATSLINEAIRDFARLSDYPRKVWLPAPVSGQVEYDLPSDFIRPVLIRANEGSLMGVDTNTAADLIRGDLYSGGRFWYLGDNGTKLGIQPAVEATDILYVKYVYSPLPLVLDQDAPSAFPESFHPALLDYVAYVYYATVEDNAELSQVNDERYRAKAAELTRFRISQETGDETFTIGIQGVTR